MKEIPLSQGKVALVDDEDHEFLSRWKWSAQRNGKLRDTYCAVRVESRQGKQRAILMHRVIAEPADGMVVDHIDGNPLNNQRGNLRVCTQQQNSLNGSAHRDSSSRFKGVCWDPGCKKWRVGYRGRYVGVFDDEVEAARAYDAKAIAGGKFAKLNFPQEVARV